MGDFFTLEGVSKRYGGNCVLRNVSLAAGGGHCIAVLGHNGAGKTTLMKLLLGLTAPSAGRALLLGRDPRGRGGGEARRSVGYLPENIALPGGATGRELLRFYAGLKKADLAHCDRLLERVGLADAARQRVRTYSKGMRQRLGLAQALLGRPRLLFLDEPTNGLDPPLRRQFYQAVRELTDEGATAVVSSHVLSEIESRADLIAILRAGELAAFGPLEALRSASRLPMRLRLAVRPEAAGRIAQSMGAGYRLDRSEAGVMDFVCNGEDKMTILRRVSAFNGVVEDVDILPPRLEEIYAHFVGEGQPS